MSDGVHLLIPHAFRVAPGFREALPGLALPHLARLLARLADSGTDAGQPQDLSPPHERILARLHGLWQGDGAIPWAAWDLRQAGGDPGAEVHAWLTPCHWQVGRDRIVMADPVTLQLSEADSRAMLQAMQPYFQEDGLTLEWVDPLRWRARGALLEGLACASLDRVSGATVDDWLPRSAPARPLRRLQQEMQMLLYTHPANAAREAAGLAPVNSFWVSGAGALPSAPAASPQPPIRIDDRLRAAALQSDVLAWARAWQELDAQVIAPLAQALDRSEPLRLTLCGDAHARTWSAVPAGWGARMARLFRPAASPAHILETL